MPFSVDEICRLATVMPGDLIIYKLNQNHSGRILYYSKGMPDFVGVTPEVYAAAVSVDIPLQPEVGEEIVINQGIGDWKLSPVDISYAASKEGGCLVSCAHKESGRGGWSTGNVFYFD